MAIGLRVDGKLVDWSHNWDGARDMVQSYISDELVRRAPKGTRPESKTISAPIIISLEVVACEVVEARSISTES